MYHKPFHVNSNALFSYIYEGTNWASPGIVRKKRPKEASCDRDQTSFFDIRITHVYVTYILLYKVIIEPESSKINDCL